MKAFPSNLTRIRRFSLAGQTCAVQLCNCTIILFNCICVSGSWVVLDLLLWFKFMPVKYIILPASDSTEKISVFLALIQFYRTNFYLIQFMNCYELSKIQPKRLFIKNVWILVRKVDCRHNEISCVGEAGTLLFEQTCIAHNNGSFTSRKLFLTMYV